MNRPATAPFPTRRAPRRARGLALPVILLFLVIITIAAAVGVRRATLTENITRNQMDYQIARQAAEAALRDGERDLRLLQDEKPTGAVCSRGKTRSVEDHLGEPNWGATCPLGQCRLTTSYYAAANYTPTPATNPLPWWPTVKGGLWGDDLVAKAVTGCAFTGAVPVGTFTGTPSISGVDRQPEYMFELFLRNVSQERLVRITARGFGADTNTEVVLQTFFRLPDAD